MAKKYRVTLSLNVGFTETVEAESADAAIDRVKSLAESDISNVGDEIDYVTTDDSCTQVSEDDD